MSPRVSDDRLRVIRRSSENGYTSPLHHSCNERLDLTARKATCFSSNHLYLSMMGAEGSKIRQEQLTRSQIRLLRVMPEQRNSYEVKTFLLDQCPPFSALSYTWGTEKGQKPVRINDIRIKITRNLELFLRQFAKADRDPEWIGCDALCINQLDPEERNDQVALMKRLYESAQEVIVWLGEVQARPSLPLHILENTSEQDVSGS